MNFLFVIIGLALWGFAGVSQQAALVQSSNPSGNVNIWNGTNTTISDYPYMVSITFDSIYFMGAGVILNNRWIATNAFNVNEQYLEWITLRVGSKYSDQGGRLYNISKVVYPDNYDYSYDWNVALVKVNKKITFNENISSIPLAETELEVGQKGQLLGWGVYDDTYSPSEVLQTTNVTVVRKSRCQKVYEEFFSAKRMICTFDKFTGPDDIYDTGDPLVVDGTLYGLYSGANEGYPKERPTMFASIAQYKDWISSTIGD